MTKIKCEINGEVTEIEVEDSFATAYLEIDAESKKNEWKHEWRKRKCNCSLEAITENGYQIAAPDDVAEEAEQAEERAVLMAAVAQLAPKQREVIELIYFQEKTQEQIAAELGISHQAVSRLLNRALAALKKILKEN